MAPVLRPNDSCESPEYAVTSQLSRLTSRPAEMMGGPHDVTCGHGTRNRSGG